MTKHQLAQELRERQVALGHVNPQIIASLSDNAIIDCYNICSDCGEKYIKDSKLLIQVIGWSKDADDFLQRQAKYSPHR